MFHAAYRWIYDVSRLRGCDREGAHKHADTYLNSVATERYMKAEPSFDPMPHRSSGISHWNAGEGGASAL